VTYCLPGVQALWIFSREAVLVYFPFAICLEFFVSRVPIVTCWYAHESRPNNFPSNAVFFNFFWLSNDCDLQSHQHFYGAYNVRVHPAAGTSMSKDQTEAQMKLNSSLSGVAENGLGTIDKCFQGRCLRTVVRTVLNAALKGQGPSKATCTSTNYMLTAETVAKAN